jgi:ATP-binding cassette, subfamily F, member 3
MIEIHDLSKEFGERTLFEEVSFTIMPGEKIGLLGRNGHGKTTLLNILAGAENPDTGSVSFPSNYKIGFLHQQNDLTEETVLSEVCLALPEELKDADWQAKKILTGLGFQDTDFDRKIAEFSGGYQMRIKLAKALVSDSDILLLDEPTNFLDITSIRWLEDFLRAWKGELVIVSHDRCFIDRTTTHIMGIHRCHLRKIKGTTRQYHNRISKEEEVYEKNRLNLDKKRKQINSYVDAFRAKARRAKSVQSSIKSLNKMKQLEKFDNIRSLSFNFTSIPFRAPVALSVEKLKFSYTANSQVLINDLTFVLERGDKICIAGPNGKGKTTLAKILTERLKPSAGSVTINPSITLSYFEQGNTADLNKDMTILEEVSLGIDPALRPRVRDICGSMMFSGDDALKKIGILSGGERCRVLLAKTIIKPSNLLILDEPTHHLDIDSTQAIIDAVNDFEGSALIVTHDETFLRKVATKLILFVGGKAIVYPGTYDEFLDQYGWDTLDINNSTKTISSENKNIQNKKEQRKIRARDLALRKAALGPLEEKIAAIEAKIEGLEKEYQMLSDNLIKSSEARDAKDIAIYSKEVSSLQKTINSLYTDLEKTLDEYTKAKNKVEKD